MSKRINVNPGQYKTAGREHQGDDVVHDIHKQTYSKAKAEEREQPPKSAKHPIEVEAADTSKKKSSSKEPW